MNGEVRLLPRRVWVHESLLLSTANVVAMSQPILVVLLGVTVAEVISLNSVTGLLYSLGVLLAFVLDVMWIAWLTSQISAALRRR